jgi:hypothetical protein
MSATYVLFVPGTRGPTVHHQSIKTAREEAKRLLDHCGASQVMICRYVEGMHKRVTVSYDPLGTNPLPRQSDPF